MPSRKKYALLCCSDASASPDPTKLHCAFCSMHLCDTHAEEAEVEGHVFVACGNCHHTLKTRRPKSHEYCTCHHEEFCDIHREVGSH